MKNRLKVARAERVDRVGVLVSIFGAPFVRNALPRAERDWSQADLAERLGVSRQTVNALETGKYDPSLPLAFKIARLFGKSIEDLFQPEEADAS